MTGTTPSMIAVEEVIADIKAGPGGAKVAAFFDFDGTLIQGYSASALIAHRARNFELGPDEFVRTMLASLGGPLDEAAFKDLMLQGIRGWVGRTDDELMGLGGWCVPTKTKATPLSSRHLRRGCRCSPWPASWASNISCAPSSRPSRE